MHICHKHTGTCLGIRQNTRKIITSWVKATIYSASSTSSLFFEQKEQSGQWEKRCWNLMCNTWCALSKRSIQKCSWMEGPWLEGRLCTSTRGSKIIIKIPTAFMHAVTPESVQTHSTGRQSIRTSLVPRMVKSPYYPDGGINTNDNSTKIKKLAKSISIL